MAKPKEIYKETYRAGHAVIKKQLLPYRLPHMKDGWEVDSMEMRAAGALDDGREFQDLRVFLREVTDSET